MKQLITLLVFGTLGAIQSLAQVNYSEHIAPIIYNNCTSCHREGEIAPFPLTNYQEVAAWSGTIQYVTEIKYMPPWKPDRSYSNFVGESGLTDEEIQLIADWVNAGVPQGNPDLEPPIPDFPSGSQLGTPDLVLTMEESYLIEGNNQDDYRVFVLPTGLSEDKEIAAVEFRPGNTRAVHHALIGIDTEGAGAALDAQTPEYGYESFGDFGVPVQGNFNGYTPGIQTVLFPEGIGTTLPAASDLLIQVHYAPLPTDESDQSSVNIFYKQPDDPIIRELQRAPISPLDLDGGWFSFIIEPDVVKTFHGTIEIDEDISMVSVYPHSHYLGKNWELFAITPENDTINIIRINDWDFNWQGAYTFERMKKIPAGSIIHVYATYDNTTSNPYNPNFPPQTVTWGEGTTDEMYLVGTTFVPYQEGDEDIIIGGDTTTDLEEVTAQAGSRLYTPYPSPTNGDVVLNYYLERGQKISLELFDAKGNLAKTIIKQDHFPSGNHKIEFHVGVLPTGIYSIRLSGSELLLTKPIVITR